MSGPAPDVDPGPASPTPGPVAVMEGSPAAPSEVEPASVAPSSQPEVVTEPPPPVPPASPASAPARAEVGEIGFVSGDVPKAKEALEKLAPKIATCVTEHGGLTGPKGHLDLQFLVRAAGIAEGVDVQKGAGVSPEAQRCVRDLVTRRRIGTPSSDPVGVKVRLLLEPAG